MSIADFHFTAATLTIHAGDTVTWSNQGPSPHTATASDGSFNTGVLNKGQTASHTFTKPGTFTYVCQIHPFMHGTVVVLAASSNPSSGPSPGTTTASAAGHGSPGTTASASQGHATTPAAGRPTLPVTGANLIQVLVAGLLLCTGGTALRLVVSRRWPPR